MTIKRSTIILKSVPDVGLLCLSIYCDQHRDIMISSIRDSAFGALVDDLVDRFEFELIPIYCLYICLACDYGFHHDTVLLFTAFILLLCVLVFLYHR